MKRNIEDIEFTIFDTETTGLEPENGDRIVELAAIRFRGEQRIAEFQALVNPKREISPAAFEVNRITSQMLEGAPEINEVMPAFLKFIRGTCLCSYNAVFDLSFLNSELRSLNQDFPKEIPVLDILTMARRLIPGLKRYALWFVAEKMGIRSGQEHRALKDAELTWQVFRHLKQEMKNKGIANFSNLLDLFSLSSETLTDLNNQKLARIQEAIGLKIRLKIKYFSTSQAKVSEREVIPKEIKQERNRSYLIGYCCLRNEERTFRIDNILHLEPL